MLETYQQVVINQYNAVLAGLNYCIDRCPDTLWDSSVGTQPLCQIVFHALFFGDVYLHYGIDGFREQPFHQAHRDAFRDYEEFEDREPVLLYDRAFLKQYLDHCRTKAASVVAAETVEILTGPSGFDRRTFTRAELHLYNIRHLQDHVSQLNTYLEAQTHITIPWFGSGWREID